MFFYTQTNSCQYFLSTYMKQTAKTNNILKIRDCFSRFISINCSRYSTKHFSNLFFGQGGCISNLFHNLAKKTIVNSFN